MATVTFELPEGWNGIFDEPKQYSKIIVLHKDLTFLEVGYYAENGKVFPNDKDMQDKYGCFDLQEYTICWKHIESHPEHP